MALGIENLLLSKSSFNLSKAIARHQQKAYWRKSQEHGERVFEAPVSKLLSLL